MGIFRLKRVTFSEEDDKDRGILPYTAGAGIAVGGGVGVALSKKNRNQILRDKTNLKGSQENARILNNKLEAVRKDLANARSQSYDLSEKTKGSFFKGLFNGGKKKKLEESIRDAQNAEIVLGSRIKENQENIKKYKSSLRGNRLKTAMKVGGGIGVGAGVGLAANALYNRFNRNNDQIN